MGNEFDHESPQTTESQNIFDSGMMGRRDTIRYREGYPGKKEYTEANDNIRFYSNEIPLKPDGKLLDEIHKKWWGDYELLERNHSYIQWLFPIREEGLNPQAQELQLHEAEAFSKNEILQKGVIKSYQMMLDFYGMNLVDEKKGEIARSENFKDRYSHLNQSYHNYLRITRILKCLGEIGLEHYKFPFLKHCISEIFETKLLSNCKTSCIRFWSQVLRDEKERGEIEQLILQSIENEKASKNQK